MMSFLELTPAILLLLGFLIFITLYSLYVTKSILHRTILLLVGILGIFYCGMTIINILGNPRPLELAFFEREKYYVISHIGIENEGIFLWVLKHGSKQPVYFSLPWSINQNEKIRTEINKAREEGGAVQFSMKETDSTPTNQDLEEDEFDIIHVPPGRAPKQ